MRTFYNCSIQCINWLNHWSTVIPKISKWSGNSIGQIGSKVRDEGGHLFCLPRWPEWAVKKDLYLFFSVSTGTSVLLLVHGMSWLIGPWLIGLHHLWMKFYFRAINIIYHLVQNLGKKCTHRHIYIRRKLHNTLRLLVKTIIQIHPANTDFSWTFAENQELKSCPQETADQN